MAKSDDNLPIDREMFWYCQNVCFGELCWWMVGWRVENYWTRIFAHQSFILRQRQKIGDQRFLSDVRLCVRWMNWWSMTMDCDDDGPALVCELMMTEYLSGSGDKAKVTHDHHGHIIRRLLYGLATSTDVMEEEEELELENLPEEEIHRFSQSQSSSQSSSFSPS